MKTVNEIKQLFASQALLADRGLQAAVSSRNYHLAALNVRQKFKSTLIQGMIEWRVGLCPCVLLESAVRVVLLGNSLLKEMNAKEDSFRHIPIERSIYIAFLLGINHPMINVDSLSGDRKLDALLGNALFLGHLNPDVWESNFTGFKKKCSSHVAVETFDLYGKLANDAIESAIAERDGELLFINRKTDEFFVGGDQTEGGGADNEIAIDYKLAALLKRVNYISRGLHVWKW